VGAVDPLADLDRASGDPQAWPGADAGFQRSSAGKHPGMTDMGGFRELVGAELYEAEEGSAVVRMRAGDQHLNPGGTVHGGAISTLVDVSMAEALNSTVANEDERPVTVEMKVIYMAPAKPGIIASTARVRKGGKRVTVVEAEVVQEENEEVVALATGTYTIVG
jgi:uncharacterized protein (TIGR00369 family)